ncbi:MAG: LysR family transcriptional regulator [Alphaproteobacteria bacterium]
MDIRSFDLNLLRTLDALLTEQNVTLAAARLNLSQPAVSAALGRLRSALDDRLLVRRGNGLVLTPRAEELRPEISRILNSIHETLGTPERFDPGRDERRFRIAASDHASLIVLRPLICHLQSQGAGALIEIFPLDERVEERLASGVIDMAVGEAWWLRMTEHRRPLYRETYVGLARADHPGLSPEPTLEEYVAQDHALVSYRGRVPGVVDQALAQLGLQRKVVLTLPHFLLAPLLVAETDMVVTIASRLADFFAGKQTMRLFKPPLALPTSTVALGWHARTHDDPACAWMRHQIVGLFEDDRS